MISVFDLFTIGIGPSSSHTVGPMRAARLFAESLSEQFLLDSVTGIRVELFGSLGATGHGHGTVPAVVLGLSGQRPEQVDPDDAADLVTPIRTESKLLLGGTHAMCFNVEDHIILHIGTRLKHHSNGMRFHALGQHGATLAARDYFSVGGGFVLDEDDIAADVAPGSPCAVPYPFRTATELLAVTSEAGLRVSEVMLANESQQRPEADVRHDLVAIWTAMQECVDRGMAGTGVLPGGLRVRRRAAALRAQLESDTDERDPLRAVDWVALYALAVNEENAAGGRVVTAPTNGAAGIIPAVLHYCRDFVPGFDHDAAVQFLLVAGAVGILCKTNASISGAEVGCQGEVGSACAMAAAALTEILGGTPAQVENAAEIGIEHHLGLTCDPVGGWVQIPCIERNAVAAMKAITAARIALRGDGQHHVGLDTAITTMRDTGADMADKYKETALGGLALTVVEC